MFWTTRMVFFPHQPSSLETAGDTLRTYHEINGAQTFEQDEEFFAVSNPSLSHAKIYAKNPLLPHTIPNNTLSTRTLR
jgi:hypothetical protein